MCWLCVDIVPNSGTDEVVPYIVVVLYSACYNIVRMEPCCG